ncbi:MAG: sodium:solute symporter family protein [Opitutaceae bacterium]|nr:sodium:solute symporter family protein [Opitutaceae bacterium]
MPSLHPLDYVILAAYFVVLIVLGKVSAKHAKTGEGFFLAGRKLGKLYQFFLNFGNSVAAADTVSTSSLVYQHGVSGVWVGFQMIFLNPYYWFMFPWYRRVRLTTMADIFQDRLGSRPLALFYASFQIVMAVAVSMAFGNLVSYKISAALVTKPEATWTQGEAQSVSGYRELTRLENTRRERPLSEPEQGTLGSLRERHTRGELNNYVTALEPWSFYIVYTLAVGIYIVLGGMTATALNESFQGVLILVFSVILIPAGLAAIGGWHQLGATLPDAKLNLFGATGVSDFTGWTIAAVFFATILQAHAMPHNMSIASSARNEFAARFGAVAGTFGKRIVTIMWAFCGLIAIVMFSGPNTLADPDTVWGTMSRQLLGPGMLGLMLAGVLAANMSTVAAQAMAVSALFARNVYASFRRDATDEDVVRAGRRTLVVVLILGVLVATKLSDVYTVLQFAMTINVPFGASILLMFTWRRLTAPAVWTAVIGSALLNIVFPLVAQNIPALRDHPALTVRATDANGRPLAVYFESVIRSDSSNPNSPLQGRGRLHTELLVLRAVGVDVAGFSPGGRLAGRFLVDALVPLVLLFGVSLVTRAPDRRLVEQFYGKMKTPVAPTPEQDVIAVEETRRDPGRFDHQKLRPKSSWEFTRWDATDTIGFAVSCLVTLVIIGAFLGLLQLVRI